MQFDVGILTDSYRRVVVIGGLLLIGLAFTKSIIIYDVMRQQVELTIVRGLNETLQKKAHFFENQIEKGLAYTDAWTILPNLARFVQQLEAQPEKTVASNDLAQVVQSLLHSAEFSAVALYDRQGDLLSQAGRLSVTKVPSLPLKYPQTVLIWDEQFILHIRKNILNNDGYNIGSIVTEKPLPQLTRSFNEIREVGKTGQYMLCAPIDSDKRKIPCFKNKVEKVKFVLLPDSVKDQTLPMSRALVGKSGVMTVMDYRLVRVIEAFAPLSIVGLGMVLRLDEEELFKPAVDKLRMIVFYLAGLIIAEILLLNWLVHKLIKSRWEKEYELQKHLKEIICLYEIRRSLGLELTVDKVCQEIFKQLIPALPSPESVLVIIEIDGEKYTSSKYIQGRMHALQSTISVNGKACGKLSVFYPKGYRFSTLEEQRFIDAVVGDLESWLERKHLEHALISIPEKQQQMLGQELHDNIGQQVAAIGYQVIALEKKIAISEDQDMVGLAASIAVQAQKAVVEIKRLAQGLLPFELETKGLKTALQTLATTTTKTYNVECEFQCKCKFAIDDNDVALNLYRIAQEAIYNAIRHGDAKHLKISLISRKKNLSLSVYDDGCGLANMQSSDLQGMGIKIMRHRAKQLNAKLKILSRVEGVTVVCLIMQV